MNTPMLALLIMAASPADPATAVVTEPTAVVTDPAVVVDAAPAAPAPAADAVVVAGPALADTWWSVGGGLGFDGPVASVERRLLGRVWMGLQLSGGFASNDVGVVAARPGDAPVNNDTISDAWDIGGDVRFRLQLLPDDSFLRPSLFLGAGLVVGGSTFEGVRLQPGETDELTTGTTSTLEARGDFGALVDVTLLPWLSLRASTTLLRVGHVTRFRDARIEQKERRRSRRHRATTAPSPE